MASEIQKYPYAVPTITEKDIIYLCRNTLSSFRNEKQKNINENDLLELIKSQEWSWNATDIDGNTILTYPIYYNAHSIVEYLLEHKKYNLDSYDKKISSALCSCVLLNSDLMFEYIINQKNMHIMYFNDMTIRAYTFASNMDEKEKQEKYLNKALTLIKKETVFENILADFINNHKRHNDLKTSLFHFLENHPLDTPNKLKIMRNFNEQINFGKERLANELTSLLEKWTLNCSLSKELNKPAPFIKKTKI